MTNPNAMFWSGETLRERLAGADRALHARPCRLCGLHPVSWAEVYVSPNSQSADPTTVSVRKLAQGCFYHPAGPVRLPAFRGDRRCPLVMRSPSSRFALRSSFVA